MRLTIGHIVGRYLPRSETFTYDLIRNLSAFDHRIFTTVTENLDLFPIRGLMQVSSEDQYFPLFREAGIKLALAHFGPSGIVGTQLGLINDIPSVTLFHGYDVSMLLREPRWLEQYRTLFEYGSHCICVSEAGRKRLIDIGCPENKVSTVHLGVDIARFCFRDRGPMLETSRVKRLLIVSRLAEKKGIAYALEAMRIALDRDASLMLRIVGEGEEWPKLEGMSRDLQLESNVEFIGALDSEGVRREMASCHLFLQPSVTASDGDQEGIPVALMEAQACGIPAISTRHSGIPELVVNGQTGLLAEERDAEALAVAILRLAANPALASELGRAGRTRVEQEFNIATQAERYSRLLTEVYEAHRSGQIAPRRQAQRKDRERILFLRAVPVRSAIVKLLILRKRYPASEIALLTTEQARDTFERCPAVDRVIACPGERLEWSALPHPLRTMLQAHSFDRVVVPYTNEDGAGYDNVREFARACRGRDTVAMPWSQAEIPLPIPEEWMAGNESSQNPLFKE